MRGVMHCESKLQTLILTGGTRMKEDFEEIFAYQDDRKATVDVREAAEILGLHPNTIYKYIRTEQLPALHIGRRWLISKAMLYRFVCGRE